MKNTNNGMNERATQLSQLSPGNGTEKDQPGRSRHITTGKYIKEDNRDILRCNYQRNPENIGYRRRMWELWKEQGRFEISEQRMGDLVRTIMKRK